MFKSTEIKVHVDWNNWKDENELEDAMADFSMDKMIELMKRNGEWDDEDDKPPAEGEEDYAEGQEEMPEEPEGTPDNDKADRPGDEHMFEQYLRSGDYQFLGKRKATEADFNDDELVFNSSKRTKTDIEFEKLA